MSCSYRIHIQNKYLLDNRADVLLVGIDILEQEVGRRFTDKEIRSLATLLKNKGITIKNKCTKKKRSYQIMSNMKCLVQPNKNFFIVFDNDFSIVYEDKLS